MSRHELIDGYISGTINRRAFVQGLTALGVTAGVAASYAVALQPAAAAPDDCQFYPNDSQYYQFYCLDKPKRPRRKPRRGKDKDKDKDKKKKGNGKRNGRR